jgi:hypothetical protein
MYSLYVDTTVVLFWYVPSVSVCRGIDYKLTENDTIVSKHVGM